MAKEKAKKAKQKDTYKYVTVPAQIVKELGDKDVKMSFFRFVELMLEDKRFIGSGKGLRAAIRVADLFEDEDEGAVVKMHPDDWELLDAVAENPENGYPTLSGNAANGAPFVIKLGRSVMAHVDAIHDAADAAPEDEDDGDEDDEAPESGEASTGPVEGGDKVEAPTGEASAN